MIFRIRRVSGDEPPCAEASQDLGEIDDDYWRIEIGSLEELLQLVDKYGNIVIDEDHNIEIYDDYRE